MGFIYGTKYIFSGNLPRTYFITSWLRQKSGWEIHCFLLWGIYKKVKKTYYMSAGEADM